MKRLKISLIAIAIIAILSLPINLFFCQFFILLTDYGFMDMELIPHEEYEKAILECNHFVGVNLLLVLALILAFIAIVLVIKNKNKIGKLILNTALIIQIIYSIIYFSICISFTIKGYLYPSIIDYFVASVFLIIAIISLIKINKNKEYLSIDFIDKNWILTKNIKKTPFLITN